MIRFRYKMNLGMFVDRSPLEVFRNYETDLSEAGFEPLFTCARKKCGGRNFNHAASPKHYYLGFGEYHAEQLCLAAKMDKPQSEVYISLYLEPIGRRARQKRGVDLTLCDRDT